MKSHPFIPVFFALLLHLFPSLPGLGQSVSGIVNAYYKVTAINTGTNTITVSNAAGLTPGTRVLLIQMQGATIDESNTASFGNLSSVGNAGNYELNAVCGVSGNDVLLQYQMLRSYDVPGIVQLVTVPVYNSVTVVDTVRAQPWSSTSGTGGVVIMQAADTIYLNSAIDASGSGFAGGALQNFPTPTYDCSWTVDVTNYYLSVAPVPTLYYSGGPKGQGIAAYILNKEYAQGKQANGGGGGNNHNTGGAGGANYGAGGNGGKRSNEGSFNCHGQHPGIGGLPLNTQGYSAGNNKIFMGGGGGSGHMNNLRGIPGGNGGGIVILIADKIVSSGNSILAKGMMALNALCNDPYQSEGDGAGGGGAGGAVILNANGYSGSILVNVAGANGSNSSHKATGTPVNECDGPGGGGGGGVLWVSGASVSPVITANTSGGANGTISMVCGVVACRGLANSATPGGNGAAIAGYVLPQSSSLVCAPLALPELNYFKARVENDHIQTWWSLNTEKQIRYYELEKSQDHVRFSTIARVSSNGSGSYEYADKNILPGTSYYRLKIVRQDGTIDYSPIVAVQWNHGSLVNWVSLQPNPVQQTANSTVFANKATISEWSVCNAVGAELISRKYLLQPGYNTISINTEKLPAGIYWLVLKAGGERKTRKFIRTK